MKNDLAPERGALSIKETAKFLGISPSSAYEAAKRGEIPTIRVGGRRLVPLPPLKRMLGENA